MSSRTRHKSTATDTPIEPDRAQLRTVMHEQRRTIVALLKKQKEDLKDLLETSKAQTLRVRGVRIRGANIETNTRNQTGLIRETIIKTAIELADAEGEQALSFRRIAAKLGCGTMSLYHHIPNKEALMNSIMDELEGEIPISEHQHWRDFFYAEAHRIRNTAMRHPWIITAFSGRPSFTPNIMRNLERSLEILHALEFKSPITVFALIRNFALSTARHMITVQEALQKSGLNHAQWRSQSAPHIHQLIESGEYPRFAEFVSQGKERNLEEQFDTALNIILDGIEAQVQKTPVP